MIFYFTAVFCAIFLFPSMKVSTTTTMQQQHHYHHQLNQSTSCASTLYEFPNTCNSNQQNQNLNLNPNPNPNPNRFICQICQYGTNDNGNYRKHISSQKHARNEARRCINNSIANAGAAHKNCNGYNIYNEYNECEQYNSNNTNNNSNNTGSTKCNEISNVKTFSCKECFAVFSSRSTLQRHKRKCVMCILEKRMSKLTKSDEDINQSDRDMLYALQAVAAQNKAQSIQIQELKQRCYPMQPCVVTNTVNQSINTLNIMQNNVMSTIEINSSTCQPHVKQPFNLNDFLNETCKNAMNITDFTENIHVGMDDLTSLLKDGYVKSFSNLILQGLNNMDVTKRPMHCTDLRRKILYVKNNDVWTKDSNYDQMEKMLTKLKQKHCTVLMKDFKKAYPRCTSHYNSTEYEKFELLSVEIYGGMKYEDNRLDYRVFDKVMTAVALNKNKLSLIEM